MNLVDFNNIDDYKEVICDIVVCGIMGGKALKEFISINYTALKLDFNEQLLDDITFFENQNKQNIDSIYEQLVSYNNNLLKEYNSTYIGNEFEILKNSYSKKNRQNLYYHVFKVGKNGIIGSLNEINKTLSYGMRIRLKNVPYLSNSISIFDNYKINPFKLDSNMLVLLCNHSYAMCEILSTYTDYVNCIGYVTKNKNKLVIDKYLEEKMINKKKLRDLKDFDTKRAYEFININNDDENEKLFSIRF